MNGLALFAGVGGLDLGVQLACPDFKAVCYVEGEAYAAAVLVDKMAKGWLHQAPVWSDVRTFDGRPFSGVVDIITAGFPCQPWSKAGSLKGTDDERWLWHDMERIISEVGPGIVFLENVPGLVDGGLHHVLGGLASLGYDAEWGCLKASEVGANHQRDRIFILGFRTETRGTMAYTDCCRFGGAMEADRIRNDQPRGVEGGKSAECSESVPHAHSWRCSQGFEEDEGRASERADGSSLWPSDADHISEPIMPVDEETPWLGKVGAGDADADLKRLKESIIAPLTEFERYAATCSPGWWRYEPVARVCRMDDGLAYRVDRVRAGGNGVVPLQAAWAFIQLAHRGGVI